MRVIVPFDASEPKTRLAPVLSAAERDAFALAMLRDVCDALFALEYEPTVLSTTSIDSDADVVVDERGLTPALNDRLGEEPVAIVMADLALATAASLEPFFAAEGSVVLAPGLGGGTNALVVREPDFRVDFHGASVRDHRQLAADAEATLATVDSFRLALDVDEPGDLAEVLLHGEGSAAEWLREAGFEVAVVDGRVTAARSGDSPDETA